MDSKKPDERHKRLVEAAALMLKAAGGTLNVTPLNKALFYLDLWSLLETGSAATQTTYIALKQGPVVAKYPERLVAALEKAGLAIQSDEEDGSKPLSLVSEPPGPRHLTTEQVKLLEQIARWAKERGATWLSDFSHKNVGWTVAWENGLGMGRAALPINLQLAMQQLADEDAWLERELTDEERGALQSADDKDGTEW
jgi:hypothetical protein